MGAYARLGCVYRGAYAGVRMQGCVCRGRVKVRGRVGLGVNNAYKSVDVSLQSRVTLERFVGTFFFQKNFPTFEPKIFLDLCAMPTNLRDL